MNQVDTAFSKELAKYGASDFAACYNCGNCTAVCNLTEKQANFPRMFIRYGVLGLKKDILKSREVWLCYSCGECTKACPRQAGPAPYMAAIRRYAIAGYEPTGLTKLLFKSNPFAIVFTLVLAVLLGFFLFTLKPIHEVSRWIFNWMPFDVIHDLGMIIFGLTGLALVIGVVNMLRHLYLGKEKPVFVWKKVPGAIRYVLNEMALMQRYRNCDDDDEDFWEQKPEWQHPWFIHWSIMWGFIGLLVATILDFIFKDPALSIWWPSRILGTLAGLLMMYGTSMAMWYRIKKVTKTYEETHFSDWMFLVFLWIAGFTGFWLEVVVAISGHSILNQVIFVIHTIISMELVILFAFSKFAHAIYRPVALFSYYFVKS
ncbi:MAG: 4Fe-4S dicluster domain-containing protein [Bacteroidia bacterium]|nr:4Fe-4S dicluster domain-containing protein [Bacteroidia bacterium]